MACRDLRCRELLLVADHIRLSSVDTQPHGGTFIILLGDLLPLCGVGLFEAFEQPAGVSKARRLLLIYLGKQVLLFALGIAQYPVEQTAQGIGLEQTTTIDCLRQGGMGWNAGIKELVETDQQQKVERTLFALERLAHQFADYGFQTREPAQGAKTELL